MAKFKLKFINPSKLRISQKEILAFLIARNEIKRLPYLFNYYRCLGIDRFFVIDNDSEDDTKNFLIQQKDTHIFYTKDRYSNHWNWMRHILIEFGLNNWCLIIDADELLIYPRSDKVTIKDLCNFLDQEGSRTMHCLLLDMYPNTPLKDNIYREGDNPIRIAPWFDSASHYKLRSRYYGGMRKRVFGIEPCISKFPLLRITKDLLPTQGMHSTPIRPISGIRGVLLHFKYNSDFIFKAPKEAERGEYWNNASEYKFYANKIKNNPNLNLFYNDSVKFYNNQQLIDLEIMATSKEFDNFLK